MLLVHSDPPIGLILSAKTGSRSVYKALRAKLPDGTPQYERKLGRHRICVDTVKEVRDAGGKVYVSIRNPFQTAISWYEARTRHKHWPNRSWPE